MPSFEIRLLLTHNKSAQSNASDSRVQKTLTTRSFTLERVEFLQKGGGANSFNQSINFNLLNESLKLRKRRSSKSSTSSEHLRILRRREAFVLSSFN